MAGFFRLYAVSLFLKKLQLLPWCIGGNFFLAGEEFYFRELLISDGETAHLTVLRQSSFDATQVYSSILTTGAVTHID